MDSDSIWIFVETESLSINGSNAGFNPVFIENERVIAGLSFYAFKKLVLFLDW